MKQSRSEQVLSSMRFGRKYHPKWIAKRQNIPLSSVRIALKSLEYGFMVYSVRSGKIKLYMTNQRDLNLFFTA